MSRMAGDCEGQVSQCPKCRGTGYIDFENAGRVESVACPDCSGTGDPFILMDRCGEEPDKSWFSTDAHLRRLQALLEFRKPGKGYRNTADMTDLELEKLVTTRVFQSVDPHRVFRYADNLNDAHRVIEHMRKLNFVVRLDNGLDGTWEATFYKNAETAHGPNDQFYAPESTLARAICVSALKAVGTPEMEGANE